MLNKLIDWFTYRKFSWYFINGQLHVYMPELSENFWMHLVAIFDKETETIESVSLNGRKLRYAFQENPVNDYVLDF